MPQTMLMRLICRLEAATSRLEDMAQATIDPSAQTNGIASPSSTSTGGAFSGDAGVPGPAPKQITELLPPAIDDFDGVMNGEVKTFVNTSEELGGLVAEQVGRCLRICTDHLCNSCLHNHEEHDAESSLVVGGCPPSLCCPKKILDYYHQSQETRYSIPNLYGNSQGTTDNDGHSWRHPRG